MSDYDFRPGGSLKLKGGVVEGGIVKKKKKSKSKPKLKDEETEAQRRRALEAALKEDEGRKAESGSSRASPSTVISTDKRTEAEKRFEETQRKRLADKVAKMATKTHKDRVSEFNNKLEALSEHHDIPKVGPG